MPSIRRRAASLLAGGLSAILACAGCEGEATTDGGGPAAITYYRDAKPIIDAKCTGCHATGGIAPFALETFGQASAQKAGIKAMVPQHLMPPWPPDDRCRAYLDDRSLSQAEIDTLVAWVDGGARAGDPSDARPGVDGGTRSGLSRVDLELKLPAAYTPEIRPDENRCFAIDWPAAQATFVTGTQPIPDNRAIVHHVIVYLVRPADAAKFQALDDADPRPGYACFGGPGGTGSLPQWLGGWVPGTRDNGFPAGTGIRVEPGSKIVVQVHYNTSSAAPGPDRTRVAFELADRVDRQAAFVPFLDPQWALAKTMTIAAGDPDAHHEFAIDPGQGLAVLSQGVIEAGKPTTFFAAGLHMHLRGTSARTEIRRADGKTECLLDIPRWDFHWQGNYEFADPVVLMPGDQLAVACHWNNSAWAQPWIDGKQPPPRDLNWGEGTDDEMCLATFYLAQ